MDADSRSVVAIATSDITIELASTPPIDPVPARIAAVRQRVRAQRSRSALITTDAERSLMARGRAYNFPPLTLCR